MISTGVRADGARALTSPRLVEQVEVRTDCCRIQVRPPDLIEDLQRSLRSEQPPHGHRGES
jgi:hypothetical protein